MTIGRLVASYDVGVGVNAECTGEDSAGDINRGEVALAQKKAMALSGGIHVLSDYIASAVDIQRTGHLSVGEINRRKGQLSCQSLRGTRAASCSGLFGVGRRSAAGEESECE